MRIARQLVTALARLSPPIHRTWLSFIWHDSKKACLVRSNVLATSVIASMSTAQVTWPCSRASPCSNAVFSRSNMDDEISLWSLVRLRLRGPKNVGDFLFRT
ncbi:hypothetical protein T07_9675 [Trichinella nelsoni]|uniref:Uncharacterized protein n=1 Tax=Trichinella nelsoni TaxID=6336 RepID=A0A0V0RD63_9BILA|nr:hypothetical protein T07_9675 [Trichinella nelsoni]